MRSSVDGERARPVLQLDEALDDACCCPCASATGSMRKQRGLQHVDAGEPRAGLGREQPAAHGRATRFAERSCRAERSTAAMTIGARASCAATLRRCSRRRACARCSQRAEHLRRRRRASCARRALGEHDLVGIAAARRRAARRSAERASGSTSRQRRMISCSHGGHLGVPARAAAADRARAGGVIPRLALRLAEGPLAGRQEVQDDAERKEVAARLAAVAAASARARYRGRCPSARRIPRPAGPAVRSWRERPKSRSTAVAVPGDHDVGSA